MPAMVDTPTGARAPLELRDYLRILGRRWFTIVFVTAIVTGLGFYRSAQQDKVYESSGKIVIGGDLKVGDIATQQQVLESQTIHDLVLQKLPNAQDISTQQVVDANVMTVSAESTKPKLAADTVNAHIDAYIAYRQKQRIDQYLKATADITDRLNKIRAEILAFPPVPPPAPGTVGTGNAQLDVLNSQAATLSANLQALQLDTAAAVDDVTVVARAVAAPDPIRPNTRDDVLIALGAGLLLGIALAFLVEYLDDSIKTRDDLERATGSDVPVLGIIPPTRSSHHEVVALTTPQSAAAEAYR
jgi:capsular polysaccharide biosynthesis protein